MKFFKKKNSGFSKTYCDEGIKYTFNDSSAPEFPLNSNSPEVLAGLLRQGDLWALLDELWAEDLLQSRKTGEWIIPFEIYNRLDFTDDNAIFQILQIPKPQTLTIEVKSSSHVADKDFAISAEAYHPDFGPLRENDPPRIGSVFFLNENQIIPLAPEQTKLFDVIKDRKANGDSIEGRMAYLAASKKQAQMAGAHIDKYLSSEMYDFKTEVGLDLVEVSPSELKLVPLVEGLEEYNKDGTDLLQDEIQTVVTKVLPDNRRQRLVLDKEVKEKLAALPKNGVVKGADVPKFITNPDEVIPDGFDLSVFSKRVKGIKTRVYNSRPYIHAGKSKEGWFDGIPGVKLDDWSPLSDDSMENGESCVPAAKQNELSEETYRKLVKRSQETGEEYVLHDGDWIRIDSDCAERFENTLSSLSQDVDGVYKIPAGAVLDIYQNLDLLEFVEQEVDDGKPDQLPDDLPDIPFPKSFNGKLFSYQLNGFRWLSRLYSHSIGGLLADEMGLGKTVQVITHFLHLKESSADGPNLVVVPKTLMENWNREIKQFANGMLSVFPYEGTNREVSANGLGQFDIILTTYDVLRRDQTKLATVDWNMVVCDEAQYAKNPTTQRTCAIKALKSKHRAALTGTPVENGLIEFWCIMDFVQPGLLGSWVDFRKNYERPIVESEGDDREQRIGNLLDELKGYYLRRLKAETLELPPKNVHVRETSLSEEQFRSYQEIARSAKAGGRGAALGAIQKLIMLCAHPLASGSSSSAHSRDIISCPKLDTVLDIVAEVQKKSEKVIIFSDYKVIQRVLRGKIRDKFGVWAQIINGEVISNRQMVVDRFSEKDGFNVIILGHLVAGVGLNITSANHVIHYTRPWNPAKENQATDRTHRIGQTKPVHVYYPIVKDARFKTVEEKMDELIKAKEDLARDVLRPTAIQKIRPEDLIDCLDM